MRGLRVQLCRYVLVVRLMHCVLSLVVFQTICDLGTGRWVAGRRRRQQAREDRLAKVEIQLFELNKSSLGSVARISELSYYSVHYSYRLVIAAIAICFLASVVSVVEQSLGFVGRVYDNRSHVPYVCRNVCRNVCLLLFSQWIIDEIKELAHILLFLTPRSRRILTTSV